MIFTGFTMFERIRDIREDLDMTQQDMANHLGVSQANYSRWETGEELIPLIKLNEFCNISNHSMDYVTGLISSERIDTVVRRQIDPKIVGLQIRLLRAENDMYQYQLAKMLNTTQSTISSYEKGETLILTAFIYQIAKQFDVSMDELCGRIEANDITFS